MSDKLTSSAHPLHAIQHSPNNYGLPNLVSKIENTVSYRRMVLLYTVLWDWTITNKLANVHHCEHWYHMASQLRSNIWISLSCGMQRFYGTPIKKQGSNFFFKCFINQKFLDLGGAATLRMKLVTPASRKLSLHHSMALFSGMWIMQVVLISWSKTIYILTWERVLRKLPMPA